MRRRRLARGVIVATVLAVAAGTLFTAVAMANELALRDQPDRLVALRADRRRGRAADLRRSDLSVGETARLELHLIGDLDGQAIGSVDLAGDRDGGDFRWLAYAATTQGARAARRGTDRDRRLGARAVRRLAAGERSSTSPTGRSTCRRSTAALGAGTRAAAELHGVDVIEGARARHCRIAIDGPTFRRRLPRGRLARRRRRPDALAGRARLLGLPRRPARPGHGRRQRRSRRRSARARSRARSV